MMRVGFILFCLTIWGAAAGAAPVIYEFRGICPDWKLTDYRYCTGDVTGTLTLNPSYVPGEELAKEDLVNFETNFFGGFDLDYQLYVERFSGVLPTSRDWTPAGLSAEVYEVFVNERRGGLEIERAWFIRSSAITGYWDVEEHNRGGIFFEQGAQAEWRLVSNAPVTVPLPATGALLGGVLLGGALWARRRRGDFARET